MGIQELLGSMKKSLTLNGVRIEVSQLRLKQCLLSWQESAEKIAAFSSAKIQRALKNLGVEVDLPAPPTSSDELLAYTEAVKDALVAYCRRRGITHVDEEDQPAIEVLVEETKSMGCIFDKLNELGVPVMLRHLEKITFPATFTLFEAEALELI